MSYKKLVTSLLVAFISSTCLFLNWADASEPELYFYPKNKWAVNATNAGQEDRPICTVSNQLNNGYVLEMAGTAQGISTINIDFRQDAFQKNIKYEVQYSLPGITRAIIPSKATKQNLIVSDLSGKRDFAEGLKTAGVLDVQIRDNNFRIYLTGLKASMPQFNDCVTPPEILAEAPATEAISVMEAKPVINANAPPPPMQSASAEPPSQATLKDPKKLRPKPSDKPRYTELLAEQLKQESEQYKPKPEPKPEPSQRLVETNESKAVPTPSRKAAPAKTSNITREKLISSKPKYTITKNEEPFVADFTDAAQNDVACKLSQVEPASAQTQSAAVNKDVINMRNKISSLERELVSMREKNNLLGRQLDTALQDPVSITSNNAINEDFVDMRNKVSSLERELIATREKNVILDEELKIALQESEKERMSVSSDNWNLERATMKYNESERQIMRLGRQLQTQRAVCEQEKTELETMLFDPKLTDQSQLAKLSSLELELDEAKSELYRQQRQYEERIKLLEQQLKGQ